MECTEVRRTAIHRPPPCLDARELNEVLGTFARPDLLDVRPELLYRAGHLQGSHSAPEGNTSGLLERIHRARRVVLVCDDGKLSSTVARMLGVCGYPDVAYLKGGLQGWKKNGGNLYETTRSGDERCVGAGGNPDGPGPIGRLLARVTPPILFAGLAGAAVIVGGLAALWRN